MPGLLLKMFQFHTKFSQLCKSVFFQKKSGVQKYPHSRMGWLQQIWSLKTIICAILIPKSWTTHWKNFWFFDSESQKVLNSKNLTSKNLKSKNQTSKNLRSKNLNSKNLNSIIVLSKNWNSKYVSKNIWTTRMWTLEIWTPKTLNSKNQNSKTSAF